VVLATGNDWRAIEAGAHAYAARDGRYTALTRWELDAQSRLVGSIEMPMALGLVGGATKTHPAAQAALRLMKVRSAGELAQVTVAVGLAQNMAALRALATEGIQRGHMTLHARNIAITAGATGAQVDVVAAALAGSGDISVDHAKRVLAAQFVQCGFENPNFLRRQPRNKLRLIPLRDQAQIGIGRLAQFREAQVFDANKAPITMAPPSRA
jgi:hydroxymethylglutaryl-CoA reductase